MSWLPSVGTPSISARDCRVYEAPAATVWRAITDCRYLYLWWPTTYDFRVRRCSVPQAVLELSENARIMGRAVQHLDYRAKHLDPAVLRSENAAQTQRSRPSSSPPGPLRPGGRAVIRSHVIPTSEEAREKELLLEQAGVPPVILEPNPDEVRRRPEGDADVVGTDSLRGNALGDADTTSVKTARRQPIDTGDLVLGDGAGVDDDTIVDIGSAQGIYTLQIAHPTDLSRDPDGTSVVTLKYGGTEHGGIFNGSETITIDPLPPGEDGTERCRLCYQAELTPTTSSLRTMVRFVSEAAAREYFDPLFDSLGEFVERGKVHEHPHPRILQLHNHSEVWSALVDHHHERPIKQLQTPSAVVGDSEDPPQEGSPDSVGDSGIVSEKNP